MPSKKSTTKKKVSLKNTLPKKTARVAQRRKKKVNPFAAAYTGKRKCNPGGNGILGMRADKTKTVTNKNNETVPLKTSAMINFKALTVKHPNFSQNEMEKNFNQLVEQGPTHRPIGGIKKTTDDTDSPLKVWTPNKTTLYRCGHFYSIYFFSNQKRSPVLNPKTVQACRKKLDFAACDTFRNSEEYKLIKKFFEDVEIKKQEITITLAQFAKTDLERKKNNFRRCISQNAVMAESGKAKDGSATKYVNKLLLTNLSWEWLRDCEWLHEIGHEIAGSQTQCVENLVGGTKHANTDMIFVEKQLRYLAECYPEGFNLVIEAELIPLDNGECSQVASIIKYTIETKDFELPFYFDALNDVQPHISFENYVSGLIRSLVEICRELNNTQPKKSPR
jgi:hypothetical protein